MSAAARVLTPVSSLRREVAPDLLPPDFDSSRTVIVFDWDDTLFPTRHLMRLGRDTMQLKRELRTFAKVVDDLLTYSLNMAPVVIVTNAETGWVEQCAGKYMPAVLKTLDRCRVISARSKYEPVCPIDRHCHPEDCATRWKVLAFSMLARELRPSQLISIGDAHHERTACLSAASAPASVCTAKTIKLLDGPTLKLLTQEIFVLRDAMEALFHHAGPVDIAIGLDQLASLRPVPRVGRGD